MKTIRPLFLILPMLLMVCSTQPLTAQGPGSNTSQTDSGDEESEEDEENENVEDESDPSRKRFWQATIPGGHYMVLLERITNISMHEYLLDGNLVVNEVTIDTSGRSLARFYHIAPLADSSGRQEVTKVIDKGRELLDRAGQRTGTDAHNMAQKTYPATTHAGMIEYRVMDLRDLDALYGSLKTAWETNKGRKLTIR